MRPPRWTPLPPDVWEEEILPGLPRPLPVRVAELDLNHLARNGRLPGKRVLAGRWGWPGEAGVSAARRLLEARDRWADPQLKRLHGG